MNCVYAKTIYTGKSVIEDAYLLFCRHQVADVTKTKQGRVLGEFDVLTPAFIDPHPATLSPDALVHQGRRF